MTKGTSKECFAPPTAKPLKRRVRREMSASLMSSTKWRTLFEAIEELGSEFQMIVKFIDGDEEHRMAMPWLHAPHDFVDSFERGPFPLLDLEWIEFPFQAVHPRRDSVPAEIVPQDIGAIKLAIDDTGKLFPLEENQRGLRILGHVRRISRESDCG